MSHVIERLSDEETGAGRSVPLRKLTTRWRVVGEGSWKDSCKIA